jgi:CDP-diacylglycerol--glycerol-3-phosphate 3-phosphatidyltransferase
MNLPNKLTCLRILLMPLTFYLIFQNSWILFLLGYILATLIGFTDYFDGYLARRYGIVTRFGQFLDPLADKIFVVTLLLYFLGLGFVPAWFVILVLVREFSMTDFRTLAAEERLDIRVNVLGKRKAVFQYLLLFYLGYLRLIELLGFSMTDFDQTIAKGTLVLLLGLVAFFTAFSMGYYLKSNWRSLFASS